MPMSPLLYWVILHHVASCCIMFHHFESFWVFWVFWVQTKWLKMTRNDSKWLEMTQTDLNWLKPTHTDSNWLTLTHTDSNQLKPTQTDLNGLKLTQWVRSNLLRGNHTYCIIMSHFESFWVALCCFESFWVRLNLTQTVSKCLKMMWKYCFRLASTMCTFLANEIIESSWDRDGLVQKTLQNDHQGMYCRLVIQNKTFFNAIVS